MGCNNRTYKTIRGDNFTINLINKDVDLSKYTKSTMTLRRTADGELILTTSKNLGGELTTLSFSPTETQNLEGIYLLDLELSDTGRQNVETLFVSDLYVVKDVSYQ